MHEYYIIDWVPCWKKILNGKEDLVAHNFKAPDEYFITLACKVNILP